MANRYVDLSGDWEAAQTGADHVGNEWKGPYGLQKAGDTVAAGDTVYIKGTADMRRLCIINLGKDIVVAGWVPGDTLKDNNTGLEWEGVYAENISTTSIVIELIAGDVYDDIIIANGVDNITQVDNTTIPSKANTFQLSLDKTAGTQLSPIRYIGVNASWVNDGTRCMFDGHGTNGTTVYLLYSNKNYSHFENMEFDDGDYRGFFAGGYNSIFINLYVHHCDDAGICSLAPSGVNCIYYKCIFKNNGTYGFLGNQYSCSFICCVAINNGGTGMVLSNNNLLLGCVIHGNTSYGINTQAGILSVNTVIDGNGNHGAYVAGTFHRIFGCRITNNGGYGIYQLTNSYTSEFFNFLLGNTLGPYFTLVNSRIEHMDGSLTAGVEGYNDRPNDDFNLTAAATLRRAEMALPND